MESSMSMLGKIPQPVRRGIRGVLNRLPSRERGAAVHHALPPSPARSTPGGFSTRYDSLLPSSKNRRIVILGHEETRSLVGSLLSEFTSDDVHVLSAESLADWDLEGLGVQHQPAERIVHYVAHLRRLGPVDVLINCIPGDGEEHVRMWEHMFFHLAHQGVYVVPTLALQLDAKAALVGRWTEGHVTRPPVREAKASSRKHELEHATQRVSMDYDWVMATKRGHHFLKVREADVSRVVESRSGPGTVSTLARHAGGTLDSSAPIVSHHASVPIMNLDRPLEFPPSAVRHYVGPIAIGSNCLTFKDRAILPEAFRHPFEPNPRTAATANIDKDFARVPHRLFPKEHLPGVYYHLDASNSGHFGHVMTEVLSRLWGWDVAKEAHPDLKAIFRIRYPDERDPVLEKRLFAAFGIAEDDITWIDRPVWVDGLVGATPLWHNRTPFHANPRITETWDRIRSALVLPNLEVPERILVTRPPNTKNRDCRNIEAVEDLFSEHGFTILRPEKLDLAEQATIFDRAKVIAGFGGSGLFNLMYSQNAEKLIFLNSEAYTARNEHLYSLVLGCESHYFWSTPEIPHPEGRWTEEAYFSPWSFDFERNEAELRAVLSDLD